VVAVSVVVVVVVVVEITVLGAVVVGRNVLVVDKELNFSSEGLTGVA